MNSLIVSDYDGTIKITNDTTKTKCNIEALKKINSQYKLMISTGRIYKSIRYDIIKYDIPFDYLSCANGNILFDNKFDVISKVKVDSRIIKELEQYYNVINSIESLNEYGLLTENNPIEYFAHLVEDDTIRRKFVNKLLTIPYIDYCTDGNNRYDIHIFSKSSKIRTIELLRKILEIEKKKIYTIGDGLNDLDMLNEYNGYIIGNELSHNGLPTFEKFSLCVNEIQHTLKKRG